MISKNNLKNCSDYKNDLKIGFTVSLELFFYSSQIKVGE